MTSRRLWSPVVAGLLVTGLLGVGGGGAVAVEPRTVTASLMVPASAFTPTSEAWDYWNYNSFLGMDAGSGAFVASLSFPVTVVSIKRITLYASDPSSADSVCVRLYRARPAAETGDWATPHICTVDSTDRPQTVYTTEISPRQVDTAFHGSHLWVNLSGPTVIFSGVRINYSYEAGA